MALLWETRPFTPESKQEAIQSLLKNSVPDRDFYLLVLGAIALAVSAIFLDSIAVLIASMIIAPLAYPILGLGLGIIVGDARLIMRTLGMLVVSLLMAIVLGYVATILFGSLRVDPLLISFSSNLTLATAIALIAGAIAAYGCVRVKVGNAMTGIGIAVSLMPPLVATGVYSALGDMPTAETAFIIFVLNVLGILAASILVFLLFGLTKEYRSS